MGILLILILIFSGCASKYEKDDYTAVGSDGKDNTIVSKDGFGREKKLTKPVNKIALSHHVPTEIMVVIGAKDKVVAVPKRIADSKELFPELSQLSTLVMSSDGTGEGVNYEKLLELKPDLYIVSAISTAQKAYDEAVEKLEPEITVIALSFQSSEKIKESIQILGRITGKEKEAWEYINYYEGVLNSITNRLASLSEKDKPRIYYEMMPGWTINDDCPMFNLQIKLSGGINIAGNKPQQWFETDKEWLAQQDPDIVVSCAHNANYKVTCEVGYEYDDISGLKAYVEELALRPEISASKAARNGRVYAYYAFLPSTPRYYISVAYMAKWLHPELFKDLDPQALHQEYLTKYLKINYDLGKHGTFAYPVQY